MNHRPVCVKCQTEFLPEKNGIVLVDVASFDDYKAWQADKYKCPICNTEIVVSFATDSYMEHFEDGFEEHVASMESKGLVIRNRDITSKE